MDNGTGSHRAWAFRDLFDRRGAVPADWLSQSALDPSTGASGGLTSPGVPGTHGVCGGRNGVAEPTTTEALFTPGFTAGTRKLCLAINSRVTTVFLVN